jgi:hypothetical protein
MRLPSLGRFLLWLVLSTTFAVVIASGPAFTAPAPAGAGASRVSGYVVSAISYQVDEHDPARLAGVTFKLDREASTATVQLGGSSSECSVSGNDVACSFTAKPRIADLGTFSVSAVA